MTKKYNCVLFDLDGTLIDTAPDFYLVMEQLCKNHQQEVLSMEAIRKTVSHGARALVKRAFKIEESHPSFNDLRQELLDLYLENLAVKTELFDGLNDLLKHLNQQAIPWGIVTNKPRLYAEKVVSELGLEQHCASLVCPDDVKVTKPDPEPMFLACNQIGVQAEQCIYVGDHKRDIDAGNAANMLTITAAYGYIDQDDDPLHWQADHLVESSIALSKLILQLI